MLLLLLLLFLLNYLLCLLVFIVQSSGVSVVLFLFPIVRSQRRAQPHPRLKLLEVALMRFFVFLKNRFPLFLLGWVATHQLGSRPTGWGHDPPVGVTTHRSVLNPLVRVTTRRLGHDPQIGVTTHCSGSRPTGSAMCFFFNIKAGQQITELDRTGQSIDGD